MAEYIEKQQARIAVDKRIAELKDDSEFNYAKAICINGVKEHINSIAPADVVERSMYEQLYEEVNAFCKAYSKEREKYKQLKLNIDKSISIPEGTTNGDVFMLMFPDLKIEDNIGSIYMHDDNGISLVIDKKWLNAPYKKEV